MDCEKFDRVVLDLLYDELDELTHAAAKRHTEHCTRCHRIAAGLRATREVGAMPIVEPPDGLSARILELEQQAHAELPLRKRLGRTVSIMASYAMRPQLAMAALLLLMIGSSLFLLRARPGERNAVHVTERGVPESELEPDAVVARSERPVESESALPAPAHGAQPRIREKRATDEAAPEEESQPAAPSATATPTASTPAAEPPSELAQALTAFEAGRFAEARGRFEAIEARGGPEAAPAALKAAEAVRHTHGCGAAVERLEQVAVRYATSPLLAEQATWQAAECYRALGRIADARRSYESLLTSAAYGQRAQAAVEVLEQLAAANKRKPTSPTSRPAPSPPSPISPR